MIARAKHLAVAWSEQRVKVLRGKETITIDQATFLRLIAPYRGVVLDIGTGDGKFVYRQAQANPERFYIGIDSSPANLAEYATKITRKPAKGGLPNVLYVIANVEQLPVELHGCAAQITINFPWGSLLNGLVLGDVVVLQNIAAVAARPARLDIFINYSVFADPVPLDIVGLPDMTIEYIETVLRPRYAQAGIIIVERAYLGPEVMKQIPTTWSRRLAFGKRPQTVYLQAELPAEPDTAPTRIAP